MLPPLPQLLAELVRLPSVNPMGRTDLPPDILYESRVVAYLEDRLRGLGCGVRRQTVLPGRDNVVAYFAGQPRAEKCDKLTLPIVTVLTSGDIVGVVFRMEYDDPRNEGQKYTSIWYDQWRVVDGRVDEHWDTATLGPMVRAQ